MKPNLLAGSLGAAALAIVCIGLPPTPANALPLPVTTAQSMAGDVPLVDVGYRGRWRGYGHRGYAPYRHARYYRRDPTGAIVAGAALGLIGAIATTAATRSYYDRPYYGYYGGGYYPASYGYPADSYGYGYPAYSYGYGYPAYGYGRRAYWGGGWGARRAYYGGGWGYRRAYYGGGWNRGWGGGKGAAFGQHRGSPKAMGWYGR
jgi:hypothetical protein